MRFERTAPPSDVLALWCTPHLACAYYRGVAPLSAIGGSWAALESVTEAQLDAAKTVVLIRPWGNPSDVRDMITDLKARGKRVFVDYDDDVFATWPQPPKNGASITMIRESAKVAMAMADRVIVPNYHLRSSFASFTDQPIIVSHHAIRDDWWPTPAERSGKPIIGLMGGASHEDDWRIVADAIKHIGNRAIVLVVGAIFPYLDLPNVRYVKWLDHDLYAAHVNACDVMLAPLRNSHFNRSKSEGRALEAAMAHTAIIASPTVYYRALPRSITPADTAEQWTAQLDALVASAELRQSNAHALRTHVLPIYDARERVAALNSIYREA